MYVDSDTLCPYVALARVQRAVRSNSKGDDIHQEVSLLTRYSGFRMKAQEFSAATEGIRFGSLASVPGSARSGCGHGGLINDSFHTKAEALNPLGLFDISIQCLTGTRSRISFLK